MVGRPNLSLRRLEESREAVFRSRSHRGRSVAVTCPVPGGDATENRNILLPMEVEPTRSPLDPIELEENWRGRLARRRGRQVAKRAGNSPRGSAPDVRGVRGDADHDADTVRIEGVAFEQVTRITSHD